MNINLHFFLAQLLSSKSATVEHVAGDIEESIKSGGLAAIKTERIRVSMQVLNPAWCILPMSKFVVESIIACFAMHSLSRVTPAHWHIC